VKPRERQPKTADELTQIIKERAARFGSWLPSIKLLLFKDRSTSWGAIISPATTPQEEAFRTTVLWIIVQMEDEFDLR
jgi:hypothetical protein